MSKFKEKMKTYNEITNFSATARRYFVNNFYDGNLTVLGILLGFFVIVLKDPTQPTVKSFFVLMTGLGTSISMLISGMSGSYLSEKAEQKKVHADLAKAMGLSNGIEIDTEKIDVRQKEDELKKAMLKTVSLDKPVSKERRFIKSNKTIHEKAEGFAGLVVSIVNGGSPFLGGLIPLIPFFLVSDASIMTFITSFIIIFICIVILGVYLGHISKESISKNIIQMLFAFTLTLIIITLFLG
jgi:predicted membrane protein (TIGR00267 family)